MHLGKVSPGLGQNVVKFKFSSGEPVGVQVLDESRMVWGRNMVTSVGKGKVLLGLAEQVPDGWLRKIPGNIVQEYAAANNGVCLLCNRTLSDPDSQRRGYGPECAAKVRP